MKSGIAAFAAAAAKSIEAGQVVGSISFLITGDEEGVAEEGTKAVVAALAAEGEVIDHCIVGEPTSQARLGDMIKIGRRGSLNSQITVDGVQGHVAYPDRAANPVPVLVSSCCRACRPGCLDDGYPEFQPSNLEITTIDVGNPATNVIPARASARINIRFNPAHTGAALAGVDRGRGVARPPRRFSGKVTVDPDDQRRGLPHRARGRSPTWSPGAVATSSAHAPELSTSGGTSDARFIRALCPVVELGLVGTTMHKVDEQAPVEEIRQSGADLYERMIERYFEGFA